MRRRDRPRRPLRGPAVVERRRRILIVCEGEVTEKRYFEEFRKWKKNPAVDVVVEGPAGEPITLVTRAKNLKLAAETDAARNDDDTLLYDEVWCCFDVDKFGGRVESARDMARTSGLRLAMSNPCFELWLILHLRENPGARDHHAMQDVFAELQPELREKHIDFEALANGYEDAVRRAQRLADDARAAREPNRNPTTEVYLLTNSIDAEGREQRERAERERREGQSRQRATEAAEAARRLVEEQERAAQADEPEDE